MSRVVDTTVPVTADDVEYLRNHNDPRWETAEVVEEKPKATRRKSDTAL